MFLQGHLIEKKLSLTLIVWMLRRLEQNDKKGLLKYKSFFFGFWPNLRFTHGFASIVQGLFKNVILKSVALIT